MRWGWNVRHFNVLAYHTLAIYDVKYIWINSYLNCGCRLKWGMIIAVKPEKNQSFNGIWTRDLHDTGAMLYQLSYEATHWELGQFIEFISPVRSLNDVKYIWITSYLNCGCRWINSYIDEWIKSYILHIIFTPHGRYMYELNKLTSLPMCAFIAQLVENSTGIAEVTGSNPVEALIFSGFFFPICLNWKIYCDDHSSLSSTSAVQISRNY